MSTSNDGWFVGRSRAVGKLDNAQAKRTAETPFPARSARERLIDRSRCRSPNNTIALRNGNLLRGRSSRTVRFRCKSLSSSQPGPYPKPAGRLQRATRRIKFYALPLPLPVLEFGHIYCDVARVVARPARLIFERRAAASRIAIW